MIKVALCDDIIDYNKKMESYIEKYGNENHVEVKITSYGSGSQLLLNYQKRKFDVIFLDVSMPEMDGFETAEEIRKSDPDVSIVFCTSYYTITNAGKGFEVAAEDFLSKPLLYRKVENILNKIYKKKLLNAEEKLFLKCHDGLITLQLSDIIYIQTENKLLILHTIHTEEIKKTFCVTYKEICRECDYRYICGGRCLASDEPYDYRCIFIKSMLKYVLFYYNAKEDKRKQLEHYKQYLEQVKEIINQEKKE